jgi:hypothetical protein
VLLTAPPGASISAGGVITWVPAQTQSPSTNIITTVVTSSDPYDLVNPQLSATNSFTVVVTEVNVVPVLPLIGPQVVNELTLLSVTNTATESNIHGVVSYVLLTAPPGASISAGGVITWVPDQTQSPSTNIITTVATSSDPYDVVNSQLSATNSFTVVVKEVNVAPVLPLIGPQVVNELTLLSVTNTATESNIHGVVSYVLLAAPPGASISAGGVITWVPAQTQSPSTNIITTVVTSSNPYDLVNPQLRATNSFTVVVYRISPLTIRLNPEALIRGGAFEFLVLGPDARECVIQASTNLVVWSAVRTNTLADGFFYFTEPQHGMSSQCFFRAILLPLRTQLPWQAPRQ